MTDLDKISQAIGALQADSRTAGDQRDKIFEKLDEIGRVVAETAGQLPALTERLEKIEPHVEDYKRVKNRGIGIIGAAAFGAAALTQLAKALQEKIWP